MKEKLEQIYHFALTAAVVLITFAFVVELALPNPLPRSVWQVLSVLTLAFWCAVVVLFITLQILRWKERRDKVNRTSKNGQ